MKSSRSITALTFLMVLLVPIGSGCGIEIGNPAGFLFSGDDNAPANHPGIPVVQLLTFNNNKFAYRFVYFPDWQLDDHDLSSVTLSQSSANIESRLTFQAQTLLEPIANLLTYVQNLEPNQTWASFVNQAGEAGVQNVAQDNSDGTSSSLVYFSSPTVLVKVKLTLNQIPDIQTAGKSAVQTFEFTGP